MEDEEIEEASVLSTNPNVRKLARRLRIQRRLEALTKKIGTQTVEVVGKTPIEKQIAATTDLLEQLSAEGDEVVSSVKVANDARELQRRREEQETRRRLLEKLEEEDRKWTEKYREITEEWPDIVARKDPLDIHANIQAQNMKCSEVLANKDALIAELKQELENLDRKFEEDQKKQNEDIDVLIERMENQVCTMTTAYRRELFLIERVIESERKALLDTAAEKWDGVYRKLQDGILEGIEKRKEVMREYEEDMKRAVLQHQEAFRAQKIHFELEIQKLQQEIENMKALCLMNVERLDYNYAVLKRREEENIIIKNEQKRRINRLQDVVNKLKKDYAELEESTNAEIRKLTEQVLKAHKDILDLEEKSEKFAAINDKKYMQIWDMNIESANEVLDKILTADKIIYEQILCLEWKPPDMPLLKKEDLPSYYNAICALEKEKLDIDRRKKKLNYFKPATTIEEINVERRLLNNIFKKISDQCDYLLEESLQELLSNYTENDKLVIRLDYVFKAIDITSEQDLRHLINIFLPYAFCPICKTKIDGAENVEERSTETAERSSIETDVCRAISGDNEEFNGEEVKLIAAVEEAISLENLQSYVNTCAPCVEDEKQFSISSVESRTTDSDAESIAKKLDAENINDERQGELICPKGHQLEIETTHVSRALKDFVERYEFVRYGNLEDGEGSRKQKITVSRSVTKEDITEFWKRYRVIFPEEKERLWDMLLAGLQKYYNVLKERHQLNAETEYLRKQNAELHRLLNTYPTEIGNERVHEGMKCVPDII